MKKSTKRMGLTYEEAIRFHGHNGPFLALGFRIGEVAKRALKSKGFMELEVDVWVKKKKPFTCLIDGLQASLGTTMGKGNISLREGGGRGKSLRSLPAFVVVKKRETGKLIRFLIKRETIARCLGAKDLNKVANRILSEDLARLCFINF